MCNYVCKYFCVCKYMYVCMDVCVYIRLLTAMQNLFTCIPPQWPDSPYRCSGSPSTRYWAWPRGPCRTPLCTRRRRPASFFWRRTCRSPDEEFRVPGGLRGRRTSHGRRCAMPGRRPEGELMQRRERTVGGKNGACETRRRRRNTEWTNKHVNSMGVVNGQVRDA